MLTEALQGQKLVADHADLAEELAKRLETQPADIFATDMLAAVAAW